MGVGAVLTEFREMGNVERPMCNGLVVREITSSKSANGLVVALRRGDSYLQGAGEGTENPTGATDSYPSCFGSSRPNQYPRVRQRKSLPGPQRRNSIERSSTAKFVQSNSFESLDNRLRCSGFSDSESLRRARLKSTNPKGKGGEKR